MTEAELESRIGFLKTELSFLYHEKDVLRDRQYRKTPKYKEKKKQYRRVHREEIKLKKRLYRQRPEVKARRAAQNKAYRERPEIKLRTRERTKLYRARLPKRRRVRLRDYRRLYNALNGERCARAAIRTSLRRHNGIENPPEELINAIVKLNEVKGLLNEANSYRSTHRNRGRVTESR